MAEINLPDYRTIEDIPEDSGDPLVRQLRALAIKSKKRSAETASPPEPKKTPVPRKLSTGSLLAKSQDGGNISLRQQVDAVERQMRNLEENGYFSAHPLQPQNEFPTLLTRLPIFRPTKPTTQQKLQDQDNAFQFSTPFGEGRRMGPPLTIRDEDTFIGLMRLRSLKLYGEAQYLPTAIPNIYQEKRVGLVLIFVYAQSHVSMKSSV